MAASFFELDLVAHSLDGRHIRPDERDAGFGERAGKGRIFGEKPVARVDGLRTGRLRRGHDLVDREIGLRGLSRTDKNRLIGHLHMHRVAVRLGIDGHGVDAEPPRGPDDAAGDFAPIGDEKLGEHAVPGPLLLGHFLEARRERVN